MCSWLKTFQKHQSLTVKIFKQKLLQFYLAFEGGLGGHYFGGKNPYFFYMKNVKKCEMFVF